ncbi:MAG TPA: alpha/beta fold hydrolase [Blastocatellia bacterium]|nr:alpha/beta fold hydrolase [Blastocatellia bacterium]
MAKRRQSSLLRMGRALLPMTVAALIIFGLFEGYVVYRLTHPRRVHHEITPANFQMLTGAGLAWNEEQWGNSDGTQATGWFLRGATGAPGIILNHSYGRERSELLTLGVKLAEAGYNVLLPDLRGHGASPVSYTSLGEDERRDVLAAIEHLKTKKNAQGELLVDATKIGVYGVSLGGYAAIAAASDDPAIRVVIADAAYPNPDGLTQAALRELFSGDLPFLGTLARIGLSGYFLGNYNRSSASEAFGNYQNKKLWFVVSSKFNAETDGANRTMLELFERGPAAKELLKVDKGRAARLEGPEQDAYDDRIVGCFRKDLPREMPQ